MGEWIHEESDIKEFIRSGFNGIYLTSHEIALREDPIILHCQVRLLDGDRDSISREVTEEDIKAALWSLKPFKAPGPDGLHAGFFQKFWPVVGDSMIVEVKQIFRSGKMLEYLNKTLIALIPKIQGPETLGNYRPISPCNIVYKVVTKIIVARLRPFLDKIISPSQTAFVSGRKGIDNAIIA